MKARGGAALLVLGGLLVALGGFLPLGSDRTQAWVLWESADYLLNPGGELSWSEITYHGGKVVLLTYPMAAGLAFAASAFIEKRAGWKSLYALHCLPLAALAAASALLAASQFGGERGSSFGLALFASALMVSLLVLEIFSALRSAPGSPRSLHPADAPHLVPAVFLLILNTGLWVFLRKSENWPVVGYVGGALGSALAVAGIVLRRGTAPAAD